MQGINLKKQKSLNQDYQITCIFAYNKTLSIV